MVDPSVSDCYLQPVEHGRLSRGPIAPQQQFHVVVDAAGKLLLQNAAQVMDVGVGRVGRGANSAVGAFPRAPPACAGVGRVGAAATAAQLVLDGGEHDETREDQV